MKFKKSDLRDGDIVTYRSLEKRIVTGRELRTGFNFNSIDNYTKNLKDKDGDVELDIIKVERPISYETVFERKEDILDEVEKRYLRDVIRPFRNKVESIALAERYGTQCVYVAIDLKGDCINLPDFKRGTMYKNMKVNKKYTLKELDL